MGGKKKNQLPVADRGRLSRLHAVLSRRDFLEILGGAGAGLVLGPLGCAPRALPPLSTSAAFVPLPSPSPDFLNRYREKWTWDSVVRGTHNLNCWYQQNCCFHIYTKDGIVVREEQVGDYPQTRPGVPDFNPRGCQKGCSYSKMMYDASRIRAPLKRAGRRGDGAWIEISWDQALTEIAEKLIDIITSEGPETVVLDPGANAINQIAMESYIRFFDLLDSVILDINCELGDDQQGGVVTYGEVAADRSGDDYFYSDLIVIWGGNPAYTQIPNFHFLTEARYNGTEIIAISPDLNASAIHADRWVPVKPGTDAALALSMAQVIVSEGLHDENLIREQSDLACLVRTDNGKLLRESDMKWNGSSEALYRWDLGDDELDKIDRNDLALRGNRPALEGTYGVETRSGFVSVRPVFDILKERLEAFTPEKASEQCGVAPDTIRMLARKFARAKAATNVCTTGISKFYHGDITMRAQILVFILCGHLGRKGAGYVTASELLADESGWFITKLKRYKAAAPAMAFKHGFRFWRNYFTGMSWEQAVYTYLQDAYVDSRMFTNSTLFWNLHAGLFEISGRSNEWDPYLKRDIRQYLNEALQKNWQVLDPVPSKEPRALFIGMGNTLRRVRGSQKLIEVLWPKLKLIVAFELRMSSTALYSDYVLPVAGAYEKATTMALNTNPIAPFLHTTTRAVENVAQSKDEWEIVCLLARKIQEIARTREEGDARNVVPKLKTIHDELTDYGNCQEKDGEKLSKAMVEDSDNLGGISWEELKKKGYVRFTGMGNNASNWGNAFDVEAGETLSPHTRHVEEKKPWMTLSGRVQFYIDHDWYLELDEALPIYKPPPKSGGNYPLTLTGGHARWSIHSTQRTDVLMLRLQRGEPCLFVARADARRRGIADGDRIEVSNDIGKFVTRAKISSAVMPGQVIMYHAWENYQFEGGVGYRNVQATPLNPIEMVGDYPFMKPVLGLGQPGQSDRDTRVEIRKLDTAEPGEGGGA